MDTTVLILLLAALIVGIGIVVVIFITGRSGKRYLDKAHYQCSWLEIENSLSADHPATSELAIIKADKLVDQALRERGFAGQTMGERLRSADRVFADKDTLWRAHKLRNKIAHEDIKVEFNTARKVLPAYRQALKDLGAI